MRKETRPQLIQRVGIRTRETNNMVERLHGTLKDRTKPMRGLKSLESTKAILNGFAIHYNYVRPHQSLEDQTPAQASGIETPKNWKALIEHATRYETELYAKVTQEKPKAQAKQEKAIMVMAK